MTNIPLFIPIFLSLGFHFQLITILSHNIISHLPSFTPYFPKLIFPNTLLSEHIIPLIIQLFPEFSSSILNIPNFISLFQKHIQQKLKLTAFTFASSLLLLQLLNLRRFLNVKSRQVISCIYVKSFPAFPSSHLPFRNLPISQPKAKTERLNASGRG